MPNKKYQEIAEMTPEELQLKLKETKHELFQLRLKLATRQLTNTAKLGEVRHRIAQIHMALFAKAADKEGRRPSHRLPRRVRVQRAGRAQAAGKGGAR